MDEKDLKWYHIVAGFIFLGLVIYAAVDIVTFLTTPAEPTYENITEVTPVPAPAPSLLTTPGPNDVAVRIPTDYGEMVVWLCINTERMFVDCPFKGYVFEIEYEVCSRTGDWIYQCPYTHETMRV